MKHCTLLLFCTLLSAGIGFIPLSAQKKASAPTAPAPKGKEAQPAKEVLANNPFTKVQKELEDTLKSRAESSSQRRKLRNRLDYLQKKLKAHLENRLEPLENKKRHLEGRLIVTDQADKRSAIRKQIAAVEKQILLNKNTADLEKYQALTGKKLKELTSSGSSKGKKGRKEKKSKKSKKSKK